MTITENRGGTRVVAGCRPECASCGRPYGRRRTPGAGSDRAPAGPEQGEQVGLWNLDELVVCDQCWALAGGRAGVAARQAAAAGDTLAPLLVLPADVEAVLAGAAAYDLLHPLDRLLVSSGVRWAVLRHIAVPARMTLAGWVLRSDPPPDTRPADSARVWLDEVEARMRAQTGPGCTFVYLSKRRRWWRVAHQLACCTDRDRRPLTWMAQEEIAAVIGCSVRTVSRAVAWLRTEGLVWEVVPGCRLPQQHVPDNETPVERVARREREAAAERAEAAAIARAHAELGAARAGHRGSAAAAIARQAVPQAELDLTVDADGTAVIPDELLTGDPLVNLAPVYELRLSAPAPPPFVPGPAPTVGSTASNHLTCENASAAESGDEFVRPLAVSNQEKLESRPVQPVDNKRRAARGLDTESDTGSGCGNPERPDGRPASVVAARSAAPVGARLPARQSESVRCAAWLLNSGLDIVVCDGVSLRWLAALIRTSHVLDQHGWSWQDLADHLHGRPEQLHLPRRIRNPRGWIRARFDRASPALPPSRLRHVLAIERRCSWFAEQVAAEHDAARRADIAARRAVIDACRLCDELGWLDLGSHVPTVRCNHDPASGGW